MSKTKHIIHIVSDSTGNLADHLFQAVFTQFEGVVYEKKVHRFIDSIKKIKNLNKIFNENDVVLHALAKNELKSEIENLGKKKKCLSYDLTGGFVEFIEKKMKLKRSEEGDLHPSDEKYFERIQAMEFTAQHDDGRRVESIKESDLIIFGISRVSKSPTSTYLGSLGYKVSNIAVTNDTNLKRDFKGIKKKAVALTIQPAELRRIRKKRFDRFKIKDLNYLDMKEIIAEIMLSEQKYRDAGFPMVDVTGMTIEETAAKILEVKNFKRKELVD